MENKIKQHFTTPFHHQSNGMIERFNRTLGEGISKCNTCNLLSEKVKTVVKSYNDTPHSVLGISPNEAIKKENREYVKRKHFQRRMKIAEKNKKISNLHIFENEDQVLIKTEVGRNKGEPKFNARGVVLKCLGFDTYLVKSAGETIKRHSSQLRPL